MAASRDIGFRAVGTAALASGTTNTSGYEVSRSKSGSFYISVTAVSGTNPTLDVIIQDSPDGTLWYTLTTFTQATAATTEVKRVTQIGRYVRANMIVGGTASPTVTFSLQAHLDEA